VTKSLWAASILFVIAGAACDRWRSAEKPHQVDYFAKKRECFELANQRQAREQATAKHAASPDFRAGFIDLLPQQCYVPSMNTCIYESGFTEVKTAKSVMTVEDLLTSEVLAGGPSDDPSYKQERARLFALCAK
jgi:hypothetical protein